MKLSEMLEKYYFHDSSLERVWIYKEKREVILEVEFCTWMQEWYSDKTDNEIDLIYLIFKNVSFSDITDFKSSDYDEILEVDLLSDASGLEGIKMHIEAANDYPIITIFAEEVEVTKISPSFRQR